MKLKAYIVKRKNPHRWWEAYNLDDAAQTSALDVLQVIKIGDALQFGFPEWREEGSEVELKPDQAFAKLASTLFEKNTLLPWIESPERNWLCQLPGSLYSKRLKQLSRCVFEKSDEAMSNHGITDLLRKQSSGNFEPSSHYQLGWELLWYDKGYSLEKIFPLMEMKFAPVKGVFHTGAQKLTSKENMKLAKSIRDISDIEHKQAVPESSKATIGFLIKFALFPGND